MEKIKYQTRRVGSYFNTVIELNNNMLLLKRCVPNIFFLVNIKKTDVEYLQNGENNI